MTPILPSCNYCYTFEPIIKEVFGFYLCRECRKDALKAIEEIEDGTNLIGKGKKVVLRGWKGKQRIKRENNKEGLKKEINSIKSKRERLLKLYDNKCAYCGSENPKTLDHVIPKSKGGSNNMDNLRPSCFECNSKKGNMSLEGFEKLTLKLGCEISSWQKNKQLISRIKELLADNNRK